MSGLARSTGLIRAIAAAKRKEAASGKPWKGRVDSTIEARFEQGIRGLRFPPWERNFLFIADRGFELDFAWPQWKAAVEIDGHVHRIKARFESDLEKHALALFEGWTILRVGGRQIRGGVAFTWAEKLLAPWWRP